MRIQPDNSATWVVVAAAARARIFHAGQGRSGLSELHDLTHPESQRHERELRTGGKGEIIQSMGAGTHQSDPQQTTKEKHAELFSKELADFLRRARVDGDYGTLVLVAAPKVLGRVRDNLDEATARTVERTIAKNWTRHDAGRIDELLAAAD